MVCPTLYNGAIKRYLIASVLLIVLLYGGDYIRLRLLRQQFGSVQVKRMYEIKLKNRKTEYISDDPQPVPCVNSALPQMGYAPCWYLVRHRVETVSIDACRPAPMINGP